MGPNATAAGTRWGDAGRGDCEKLICSQNLIKKRPFTSEDKLQFESVDGERSVDGEQAWTENPRGLKKMVRSGLHDRRGLE